jgi:hypothetical protein
MASQTATYKGTHKMNDNIKTATIYEGKTVHGIIKRKGGAQFSAERIDILRRSPTNNPGMPDVPNITHDPAGTESYMSLYIDPTVPGYSDLVGATNCRAIIRVYTSNPNFLENTIANPNLSMGEFFENAPKSYSLDTFFPGWGTSSPSVAKKVDELHIYVIIPNGATLRDLEENYAFIISMSRDQADSDASLLTPPPPSLRYATANLIIRGWDATLDFHID